MRIGILTATMILGILGGCKKEAAKSCLKGKVVRITCASTVIQILNNDTLGEDGWVDKFGGNNNTYNNVFNLGNKCDLPSTFSKGDIIWFTITPQVGGACFVCEMADYPPDLKYYVKNISGSRCQP